MAGDCSIGWRSPIKTCPRFCLWLPPNSDPSFISKHHQLFRPRSRCHLCWSQLGPARTSSQEHTCMSLPNSAVTSRWELESIVMRVFAPWKWADQVHFPHGIGHWLFTSTPLCNSHNLHTPESRCLLFKNHLFIIFSCAGSLLLGGLSSLVEASRGYSPGAGASHCDDFSRGTLALGHAGYSRCGTQA